MNNDTPQDDKKPQTPDNASTADAATPEALDEIIVSDFSGDKVEKLKEAAVGRPISEEDIRYLLELYPFLQVINNEATFEDDAGVKLITAQKSGWTVHDYGDAMSSSPGRFMFGDDFVEDDDEGGEGGDSGDGDRERKPGRGTVVKQAFDTAEAMIQFAKERGWRAVRVVDGSRLMQWAAWVKATGLGLDLIGFNPTKEERDRRARLARNVDELERLRVEIRPRKFN